MRNRWPSPEAVLLIMEQCRDTRWGMVCPFPSLHRFDSNPGRGNCWQPGEPTPSDSCSSALLGDGIENNLRCPFFRPCMRVFSFSALVFKIRPEIGMLTVFYLVNPLFCRVLRCLPKVGAERKVSNNYFAFARL